MITLTLTESQAAEVMQALTDHAETMQDANDAQLQSSIVASEEVLTMLDMQLRGITPA